MRQNHKGTAYPPESTVVSVQQLKPNGHHNRLIRIFVSQSVPIKFSTEDILAQAEDIMEAVTAQQAQSAKALSKDPREFCPWLRRIHWQDIVQGKHIETLMALVEQPRSDELGSLSEGVKHLLCSALPLFASTSELILQHLNTPKQIDE
jgi:hypothetical protein